ncbi:MAG TPA: HD domain-containing phosphohydrolase [Anaeromyxobacteraceae bacterium]|nr:HD domain-containing phosphohydrolase [Anaeromyxobacteraceae bacterium]
MFDRLSLPEDLVDCRGFLIARRGFVVSPEAIDEAAAVTVPEARQALAGTPLAADVAEPLSDPTYVHLFQGDGVRDAVERVLLAVRLPSVLFEELLAARRVGSPLHRHAFATAAVAVRMLLSALGEAKGLSDLGAAALLHDVGMRHLPSRLLRNEERLSRADGERIAAHPLLGGYHLATVLGRHPAVVAARSHHWRCGQGYPVLAKGPPRSIEVIAVASAFAALTQPRSYRSGAYDARGGCDVLVEEAGRNRADGSSVKLLVHALRGGRGDPRNIRFGHERDGHAPERNGYQQPSAPQRNML